MNDELDTLRERVARLETSVGDVRTTLDHCLRVSDQPENALMLARRVVENITRRVLEAMGISPPTNLASAVARLEADEVMSRGLVPGEIITLLHMVRVIGNKAAHDTMRIQPTSSDVDLVMRSVLRIVEWFFAEFERGPRLTPLFAPGASLPPLRADGLPPAVRMPPLVIVGRGDGGSVHKYFVFTTRLLGFGREKPSRDPRVDVVSRLLPCPDPGHRNWNLNLENISRFHAQIWWQRGRAEIRDEASDKGVFVDGHAIARGVWTPCSFDVPAHVKLGPSGFEFEVAEVIRQVDGVQVPSLKLRRLGNWEFHHFLLVGRPLVAIGSDPGCLACFAEAAPREAVLRAGPGGWVLAGPGGSERGIDPGRAYEVGASGLRVKRTEEADFLS